MDKPTYEDLYEFYQHCVVLFAEGVELMTRTEIYESIKKECNEVPWHFDSSAKPVATAPLHTEKDERTRPEGWNPCD